MGRRLTFDIDDVLDAAMRVFWEKGYEGSSLDDLIDAMGISRTSLYHSFKSKEALFQRVLRRYERRELGFAWRALRLPTVRQVVEAFVEGFLRLATTPAAPRGCLGTHAAIACSDEAEPIRLLIIHRREVYLKALTRRFRQARAARELSGAIDPAVLAVYIITVVNGLALQAKCGVDATVLLKAARMAISAIEMGTIRDA